MENLSKNSMNLSEAKRFLIEMCGNDSFGKQLQQECLGRIFEVGYPVTESNLGRRKTYFVNEYTNISLTNHYKEILRSYE